MIAALTNVAMLDINDNRLPEGEALLRETIRLTEKLHGEDSPNLWPILTTLAKVSYQRGDVEEEARLTDRALDIARRSFPTAHRWTAGSLVERGLQFARAEDWKRGEAMIDEGIVMLDQLGSSEVAFALRRKAIAQRLRDDDEGAMQSLERAWDICRSSGQSKFQVCLVVRANRASMLARTGKGAEALSEADAAIASLADSVEQFSERGQAQEARAQALSALGRHDEALAEQDAVIALLTEGYGPDHAETRRVSDARRQLEATKLDPPK
jgi:tetratricopeptide (TPR) repeat protein